MSKWNPSLNVSLWERKTVFHRIKIRKKQHFLISYEMAPFPIPPSANTAIAAVFFSPLLDFLLSAVDRGFAYGSWQGGR
jgi:hypothetical protein